MRQPIRPKIDYERIKKYDEWIRGTISEIKLDEAHQFKGEFAKVGPAVMIKIQLEGHQFPHTTGWMTFSYGEKSNLFTKYLRHLVENAQPDMRFDLDALKGMEVKTMWSKDGEYDRLEQIRPFAAKIKAGVGHFEETPDEVVGPEDIVGPDDQVPF